MSNNEEDVVEELCLQFAASIELSASGRIPRINTIEDFEQHIGGICSAIFKDLGSTERERTYQVCLMKDLEKAGLEVQDEAQIAVRRGGEVVAHRRADLVVTTPADGKRIVLELKAVITLNEKQNYLEQLEFYMHHLDVDTGYLINFPHDNRFPTVPGTFLFSHTCIHGKYPALSDRRLRFKQENALVQIEKVSRKKIARR